MSSAEWIGTVAAGEPHGTQEGRRRKFIERKKCVVTGGGSGLGAAIAVELACNGAGLVALVDLNEAGMQRTQRSIAALDGQAPATEVRLFRGDVTDEAFREGVYDACSDEEDVPRICIPAAGITGDQLAVKFDRERGMHVLYPPETFDKLYAVNLRAPAYWSLEMVRRIADRRRARGKKKWDPGEGWEGVTIFICSVCEIGNKGQISYSATKGGLRAMAANQEMEQIFHGCRVGVLHPGLCDTDMVRRGMTPEAINYFLSWTRTRTLISPEAIGEITCFMVNHHELNREVWAGDGWPFRGEK